MASLTSNHQMHIMGNINECNASEKNVPNATTGINAQDQIKSTHEYVQRHHLNELFAHLMQLVLYYQPENPR